MFSGNRYSPRSALHQRQAKAALSTFRREVLYGTGKVYGEAISSYPSLISIGGGVLGYFFNIDQLWYMGLGGLTHATGRAFGKQQECIEESANKLYPLFREMAESYRAEAAEGRTLHFTQREAIFREIIQALSPFLKSEDYFFWGNVTDVDGKMHIGISPLDKVFHRFMTEQVYPERQLAHVSSAYERLKNEPAALLLSQPFREELTETLKEQVRPSLRPRLTT